MQQTTFTIYDNSDPDSHITDQPVKIFTDGSLDTNTKSVSCAFHVPDWKVEKSFKLNCGNFIMTAILEALTWVRDSGFINAAILTDSLITLFVCQRVMP